jgi:hypothetical protein
MGLRLCGPGFCFPTEGGKVAPGPLPVMKETGDRMKAPAGGRVDAPYGVELRMGPRGFS